MFIELVKGVALLLALCFLHGFNIRLWRHRPLVGQAFSGLIFGGICVVGMLTPVVLMPGVIFDARSVVLCMAGLFGGPVVAVIAGAMTMGWRLWIGGAGMGGMAQTVRGVASRKLSDSLGFDEAVARGQDVAWNNRASRQSAGGTAEYPGQSRPEWAQDMQRRQDSRHHRHLAAQVVREGDRGGAAALPDIAEKED